MENYTSILEFHILPFFLNSEYKLLTFSIVFFFLFYLIGILVNFTIIIVIFLDQHLHTPMYLFLCNLSVVDMCYTTITIPKLLYICISRDNIIFSSQCLCQVYFLYAASTSEVMILLIMAYDRYVAICHPLYYHKILNNKICILFMMVTWISACVNASFMANAILKMFFCSSDTIHQFFCDAKALLNISCAGRDMFYMVVYINYFVLGVCPVVCHCMSYVQIFKVILSINSKDGRRKAFSTCSSHLSVLVIFCGSGASAYMTPPSEHSNLPEEICTVFYTTVTPLLNPLIYTLRNKKVKLSLFKLMSCF